MARLLYPSLLLLAVAPVAFAQDPARRDTLPPLAPQDVEIRGQLRVRLPSIPRQPLGGIAPVQPPRRLDPQRRVEAPPAYETPPLPETPLARFEPPPLPSLTAGAPQRVGLEGGAGLHLSRFGRLTAAGPVAPNTRFYLSTNYDGTDGERLDSLRRGFDHLRGTAGLHIATARTLATLEGGGFWRSLAQPVAGDAASIRTTQGGHLRLGLETALARMGTFRLRATPHRTSVEDGADTVMDETGLSLDAFAEVPAGRVGGWAGGGWSLARAGSTQQVTSDNDRAAYVAAGVTGTAGVFAYRAGPALLFYRLDDASAAPEDAVSVSVEAEATAMLSPSATLRLSNRPVARIAPLAEGLAAAPYLAPFASHAEAVPVDARVQADITRGAVTFSGWGGYWYATQQRYLVSEAAAAPAPSRLLAAFGEVAGPQAGLAFRVAMRKGLSAYGDVTLRGFTFVDADGAAATVPYVAPVSGSLHLSYGLPGGGVLQASVVGEGARFAGRNETLKLKPLVDVDLYGAVPVAGPLFLIVRADRLLALGRTRFHGYPESTALVSGGMGIRW